MKKELEKKNCTCEDCHCDEECNCGCLNDEECHCDNECNCDEESNCGCLDACNCNADGTCDCDDDCDCKEQEHKCKCELEDDDDDDDDYKEKKHKKEKKDKIKKLEHKIDDLKEELKEAKEKTLLAKAELVNYRKRKDEDVMRILKYANEDLVTEMLSIIDNFESAIKMDDDNLQDEVSKFLTGFKMIYCNLISVLEKYGVKVIDGNNKLFDPTYHQAVIQEKSDLESGMVIEVLRKGYILKDKVIRPAMVKVSE